MTIRKTTILAVVLGVATLAAAMPAEAGRRTGSWRYSPDQIYDQAYAQAEAEREAYWYAEQRRQQWHARHGWGPRYGYPVEYPRYAPPSDSFLYGD
jgi:hypothetical protein